MIPFFEDLYERLKAVLDTKASSNTALSTSIWTNARAALIDKLDTALSTAVWTNARAGHIDKLNTGGIPGTFKSVQSGYVSYAYDNKRDFRVTISPVNVGKCYLIMHGGATATENTDGHITGYIMGFIQNSTTLLINAEFGDAAIGDTDTYSIDVDWQIVEHY